MGWRYAKEALAVIRSLEPFEIMSVEQPLPADDLHGLALLRQWCTVPIMVDESVWSPQDAWRVLRAGSADIINVYVSEAGGLQPAREIAGLAAHEGVGVVIGSMPELGIGTAAQAHLGVSLPLLAQPSDVAGRLYQSDDVVSNPTVIEDGYALAPVGVGLGVEVDWDKVERYRVDDGGK